MAVGIGVTRRSSTSARKDPLRRRTAAADASGERDAIRTCCDTRVLVINPTKSKLCPFTHTTDRRLARQQNSQSAQARFRFLTNQSRCLDKRRRMCRIALSLLVCALAAACAPRYADLPMTPTQSMAQAEDALRRGEYSTPISGFADYLATGEPTFRARAFFEMAQAQYGLENYEAALDILSDLEDRLPERELRRRSRPCAATSTTRSAGAPMRSGSGTSPGNAAATATGSSCAPASRRPSRS